MRRTVEFHGHMCPGLAMGIRAAEVALREIGPPAEDEEVVAVVETDMCGVDAIQFLLGCTFGKGNLVHRDYGKNAYTVFRRSDGKAVRISERPGSRRPPEPEPESEEEFFERQRQRVDRILTAPIDDLYQVRPVDGEAPRTARIFASVDCAACGEATMETRIRRLDGQELCPPCFEERLSES
ncbi:MAG: FmdE family protein [Actinomycetota bacterium]|nr:FmdE family protein [Actinomycetota bacterium]